MEMCPGAIQPLAGQVMKFDWKLTTELRTHRRDHQERDRKDGAGNVCDASERDCIQLRGMERFQCPMRDDAMGRQKFTH